MEEDGEHYIVRGGAGGGAAPVDGASGKSTWVCAACTFENNESAGSKCTMCGTDSCLLSTIVQAESYEWTCSVCTLLNPPTSDLCAACETLNPKASAAAACGVGTLTAVENGAEAEVRLLPRPRAVQFWVERMDGDASDTAAGAVPQHVRNQNGIEAAQWLVEVVAAAHLSKKIKAAGRELMATRNFAVNLEAFYLEAGSGYRGTRTVWDEILMKQLDAKLAALGEEARAVNEKENISDELGSEAVAAISTRHAAFPAGGGQERARQDTAMPQLEALFSWEDGWKDRPEHVYIHVLTLLAAGLDPIFDAAVSEVASDIHGIKSPIGKAAIKSYGRMAGKLQSPDDHRYDRKPRPAMNIDIVRRLAEADTAAAAHELICGLSTRFSGFSHLKCLGDLAKTNPEAAAGRYHMLPVMITVLFAPAGITVGTFLDDAGVRASWASMRSTRPGTVSSEQWTHDHDAAVAVLHRCRGAQVAMHCEVQLVLAEIAEIRHRMHEIYKVKRADSGALLYADVAKPADERVLENAADLALAAQYGRIDTCQRLLLNDDADVNRRHPTLGGGTALFQAALMGHLSIVLLLLEAGADPSVATDIGMTPLYLAAQFGHFECTRALVEAGADPCVARYDDGTTPVWMAARHGCPHALKALLEAGGIQCANDVGNDEGTPLYFAIKRGHTKAARLLIEVGKVSAVHALSCCPQGTPMHLAVSLGHVPMVEMLLAVNKDTAGTVYKGLTPLHIAAICDQSAAARLLLAAGADPAPRVSGSGRTPLEIAMGNMHLDVVGLLCRVAREEDLVEGQGSATFRKLNFTLSDASDDGDAESGGGSRGEDEDEDEDEDEEAMLARALALSLKDA